ncbi:zinc finger protein 502-like [Echeneis naucrates]|uniref:zinc finger protein 502-like n=1 Tax=Echeneis naucrates TaxID=173247 RepID=UPI001113BFCF|nr:zinc finger protein 502-like [Echeneis naucrates]
MSLCPVGRFWLMHQDPEVSVLPCGLRRAELKMFLWMKRSGGGLENISKAEILRGIVTEKLSTAAQEILAVVERTVAGYEEEASGLRREVERQRRQLELLLQPRVKLERRDLDGHDVMVVSEDEEEDEERHVEDAGGLDPQWYQDEYEEEDGEKKEEQSSRQPESSSRQKRADLEDPDYQISPRVQSDRRKPGRPRSSTQNHVDLRICILEDLHNDVLSKTVFQKCPVQELRCPTGLQETDFLDLLRSSFPRLAADKPFEVFTSDRSRRLQPLSVKSLTPEEISRTIRHSVLYVRLKADQDRQTSSEDLHPLQRPDDASMAPGQTDSFWSPGNPPEKRRRGRPRLGKAATHHHFRICMLEDSQSGVQSSMGKYHTWTGTGPEPSVSVRTSAQDLSCPRGLQEADFLDLLRSTFPQLAGDDKPFDVFKSDRSRRLERLRLKSLTPEELCRSMKSSSTSRTLLYLRLKTGAEEDDEELNLFQRDAAAAMKDEAAGLRPSVSGHEDGDRLDVGCSSSLPQSQNVETEDEDADEGDVASNDDDWKPQPDLQSMAKRRQWHRPFVVEQSKTACKVCGVWYRMMGSLIKHAWSHLDESQGVCGVCGERSESVEELKKHLRKYQKTHDCSECGKSFSSVAGLTSHASLHTGSRRFKCDVCNKTFKYMSGLSVHHWVHVADKPHKCDICPKAFGLKAQLKAHTKVHTGRERFHCHICGKSVYDLRSLTRHKATHSGERRYGCEVCGKRFKILGTLKSHEKIHTVRDRPYLCHICCKTFLSNCGLTAHMKTHSSERPFVCVICSKGFISNGELKAHMRVHTGEAPYGCSRCGRFFKRKTHLSNHVKSHLGIKQFVCSVCGKACSRQEHLTVHMRTHNGERPYKCSLCEKAFTQSHCLKTHMKSHQEDKPQVPDQSAS